LYSIAAAIAPPRERAAIIQIARLAVNPFLNAAAPAARRTRRSAFDCNVSCP
jgi:hypothetical protein